MMQKKACKQFAEDKQTKRKVSNIHQLCDVIMEEWKRIPVKLNLWSSGELHAQEG